MRVTSPGILTPKITKVAIAFLWAALAIQTAFSLWLSGLGAYTLIASLPATAVKAFVIYSVSMHRNWARIIYLVVFSVFFMNEFALTAGLIFEKSNLAIPKLVVGSLEICALVILFLPESNEWFRQGKSVAPADKTAG